METSEFPRDELNPRRNQKLSWSQITASFAVLILIGILVAKFTSSDLTALDDHEATTENKPIKADVLENDYGLFNRGQLRVVDLQRSVNPHNLCGKAWQGLAENHGTTVFFDPGDAFECLGADQEKDIALTYVVGDVPTSCEISNSGDVAKLSSEDATEVQEALNDLLYGRLREPLKIDGVIGSKTRGAIGVWQQQQGFLPSEELSSQQHRCLLDQREAAKDRSFGHRDAAQLIITVKGENDPPLAKDDEEITSENAPITANVLNNDSDPDDGDQLRVVELGQSADPRGSLALRDNKIVFDPGDDFDGLATGSTAVVPVAYVVEDSHGGRADGLLTITVQGENDTPQANDDEEVTLAKESIAVDVLKNDHDPDAGDQLRIADLQQSIAPQGSAEIRQNAVFFDPGDDFDYLAADETADVILTYFLEDLPSPASCEISAVDGEAMSSSVEETILVQEALNGVLRPRLNPPLRVDGVMGPRTRWAIGEWQEDRGFVRYGELSSQERQCLLDQHEHVKHSLPRDQDAARLIVTVKGENDRPVVEDDQEITLENQPIIADVLRNDYDPDDGDQLRIADLKRPADFRGSVEIRDNAIFYEPGDAFDYLSAGETEDVTLTYVVEDSHGQRTDTRLTILVRGENDPPAPQNDRGTTPENEPIIADVLRNDYDPDDGDQLRIADLTQPADFQGSAEIRGDAILYDPGSAFDHLAAGETEDVNLTYVVEDSHGRRTDTRLTITVQGENEEPVDDGLINAALRVLPAQFAGRKFIRPDERPTLPPNYRQGGCGFAQNDQVSGVPFCARDNTDRVVTEEVATSVAVNRPQNKKPDEHKKSKKGKKGKKGKKSDKHKRSEKGKKSKKDKKL